MNLSICQKTQEDICFVEEESKKLFAKTKKHLLKGIARVDGPSIGKIQQNFIRVFQKVFFIFWLFFLPKKCTLYLVRI